MTLLQHHFSVSAAVLTITTSKHDGQLRIQGLLHLRGSEGSVHGLLGFMSLGRK